MEALDPAEEEGDGDDCGNDGNNDHQHDHDSGTVDASLVEHDGGHVGVPAPSVHGMENVRHGSGFPRDGSWVVRWEYVLG